MTHDAKIMDRIRARMTVVDMGYATPCWISNRATQRNGYTKIGVNGKTKLTHRVAYEAEFGAIPDGLDLDHLCRNRPCCRPTHLEPVTTQINNLRGEGLAAIEAAMTQCHRGHEFTPENTYRRKDRTGRQCRACAAERARNYRRAA